MRCTVELSPLSGEIKACWRLSLLGRIRNACSGVLDGSSGMFRTISMNKDYAILGLDRIGEGETCTYHLWRDGGPRESGPHERWRAIEYEVARPEVWVFV